MIFYLRPALADEVVTALQGRACFGDTINILTRNVFSEIAVPLITFLQVLTRGHYLTDGFSTSAMAE